MMGKMKKAGVSLSLPIVLRALIFPSLQPSCDTNKPLNGTSMFAGKSSLTCIKK